MAKEPTMASAAIPALNATHICGLAIICLGIGLATGYISPGFLPPDAAAKTAAKAPRLSASAGSLANPHAPNPHAPTLQQMQLAADQQVSPLREKLKTHPSDSALLAQIGAIYHTTHQFKRAADSYQKAVQADPQNVALRTRWSASLYRSGDVDGALTQLNQALTLSPRDANALFDLGMIKLQGKGDGKGALVAWQQLLKSNPQLSPDRKTTVLKLMAGVLTTQGDQQGIERARNNDQHK